MMVEAPETTKICTSCGGGFTESQSSGKHCFKCKVNTIGFTWRGPSRASREDFHNNTIRSVLAESDRNIAASGGNVKDYETVGPRWI